MAIKVQINNIGKLTDTEICIASFTVFAGPNNTGKSFVSKLLYSVFDALNSNHSEAHIKERLKPVRKNLDKLKQSGIKQPLMSDISNEIRLLEEIADMADNFGLLDEVWRDLKDTTEKMQKMGRDVLSLPLATADGREGIDIPSTISNLNIALDELAEISDLNLFEFIKSSMQNRFYENLIHNFQVGKIAHLTDEENVSSMIEVERFGKFFNFINEEIDFEPDVSLWQQYSRLIYIESPVYWKLKNALEYISYEGNKERLSGVPGYFYDLARALKFEYTGDIAFPEVLEKLTGEEVIGGKIAISDSGKLSFQENGRNFSLPVTAMGIANLGILALLIERKILDVNTLIFIDEPEAHLHPAWQIIMAEALFELSLQGVSVVIATHSVDILKWLEVHVKKKPEYTSHIALNQFPVNRRNVDEDFETKMANIKQELTKPFSDLYLEGV